MQLEPCRLPGLNRAAHCGVLERPENPDAPAGPSIPLRIAVVPAVEPSDRPPLFMLAGGPGQAATEAWPGLLERLEAFTGERDVVLVDQRGTGASRPLDCRIPEGLAEKLQLDYSAERVSACLEGIDAQTRYYTTPFAADDLDAVREALGYASIDLVGGSYGTRAALVYLRRHPEHVHAVVLDGVAPVDFAMPSSFATDAQRAFDLLVRDCDADPSCRAVFGDVSGTLDAVLDSVGDGQNLTVAHPRSGDAIEVELDRDTVAAAVRALLYQPQLAVLLPLALQRARSGSFSPLVAQATLFSESLQDDFSEGMFLSVVCAEDVPFIEAEASGVSDTFLSDAVVKQLREACGSWPRGIVPEGYRAPIRSDVPVLLLSGELDPVTPPRWAEHVAGNLTDARTVVVPGTGHGTLYVGCVPELIDAFLDAGDPSAIDPSCLEDLHRPPFFIDASGPPH